jgi:hypothetical protein
MTPKGQATKAEIDKENGVKLKSFCMVKETAKYRELMEWGNICMPQSIKRLMSKNYRELKQLSNKTRNNQI